MKIVRTLAFLFVLFIHPADSSAQENDKEVTFKQDFKIQKHTLMERFEPEYVISFEERTEKKRKRIANVKYALGVLDTIQISNRKRKQLLRDLKYNPFSDRLNKFIVDAKFVDEDVVYQHE